MSQAELAQQSMIDEPDHQHVERLGAAAPNQADFVGIDFSPKLAVQTEIRVINTMNAVKEGHHEGFRPAWMIEAMFSCFLRWQDVKDDDYTTFEIESGFNYLEGETVRILDDHVKLWCKNEQGLIDLFHADPLDRDACNNVFSIAKSPKAVANRLRNTCYPGEAASVPLDYYDGAKETWKEIMRVATFHADYRPATGTFTGKFSYAPFLLYRFPLALLEATGNMNPTAIHPGDDSNVDSKHLRRLAEWFFTRLKLYVNNHNQSLDDNSSKAKIHLNTSTSYSLLPQEQRNDIYSQTRNLRDKICGLTKDKKKLQRGTEKEKMAEAQKKIVDLSVENERLNSTVATLKNQTDVDRSELFTKIDNDGFIQTKMRFVPSNKGNDNNHNHNHNNNNHKYANNNNEGSSMMMMSNNNSNQFSGQKQFNYNSSSSNNNSRRAENNVAASPQSGKFVNKTKTDDMDFVDEMLDDIQRSGNRTSQNNGYNNNQRQAQTFSFGNNMKQARINAEASAPNVLMNSSSQQNQQQQLQRTSGRNIFFSSGQQSGDRRQREDDSFGMLAGLNSMTMTMKEDNKNNDDDDDDDDVEGNYVTDEEGDEGLSGDDEGVDPKSLKTLQQEKKNLLAQKKKINQQIKNAKKEPKKK